MKSYQTLLEVAGQKLNKALHHLNYSYQKIQKLPLDVTQMDKVACD